MVWVGLLIIVVAAWAIWRSSPLAPMKSASPSEDVAAATERKPPLWQLVLLAMLLVGGLKACADGFSKPSGFGDSQAFQLCQAAMTKLARDPEKAQVPWVQNMGAGSEYYYAWGAQTKLMRMRNGLGLDVAVSGSCIVDGQSQRITSLTLDGKTVL